MKEVISVALKTIKKLPVSIDEDSHNDGLALAGRMSEGRSLCATGFASATVLSVFDHLKTTQQPNALAEPVAHANYVIVADPAYCTLPQRLSSKTFRAAWEGNAKPSRSPARYFRNVSRKTLAKSN